MSADPLPSVDLLPSSDDSLPSVDLPHQVVLYCQLIHHQSIHQKLLTDFFTDNCKGSDQDIVERGKQLFYSMCLQEEECVAMEKATRTQRDSYIWYQQWYGRLTASSFHSVLTMKNKLGQRLLTGY